MVMTRSDTVVRVEAMDALLNSLGVVDTARFICMIKHDTFDYTEWQRGLFKGMSIDEIHNAATECYEKNHAKEE